MKRLWCVGLMALSVLSARAETDTVLVCYETNVLRFTVTDGVWSTQGEFVHRANNYGGTAANFAALASDGRRVFVGELGSPYRILEFDLQGIISARSRLSAAGRLSTCACPRTDAGCMRRSE